MARRVALLQICSNPVSVVEDYEETPAKLLALDSILEELIERQGEKVIVWSFFTASIDAICDRYAKYRPARFDGVVSDPVIRRESVQRFQDDGGAKLFVANPAAAGAGLTLHKAKFAVYESLSNQAAHYLQSLDRIHRRGQTRAVEYLVLLCDATVELQEYDRLTSKERAAQDLLGDAVAPPLTRETMLDEAIAASRLLV
jgi:SNF2 family DNA or RNA helicase